MKNFRNFDINFNIGDIVMVTYKDSKYYKQIGKILFVDKHGDCEIHFEYGGVETFYKTNLEKIVQVIEIPSGEILYISYEDSAKLALYNIIRYDFDKKYYYIMTQDIWEIKDYVL